MSRQNGPGRFFNVPGIPSTCTTTVRRCDFAVSIRTNGDAFAG